MKTHDKNKDQVFPKVRQRLVPAAGVAHFDWQWDESVVVQLVLRPLHVLSRHLLFPPLFTGS